MPPDADRSNQPGVELNQRQRRESSGGPGADRSGPSASKLKPYAKLQSATTFLRDLGILTPDHAQPVKPPPVLPQQTAPEVKAAAMGLADGPKLRRWEPIEGEIALRHAVRGSPLETKLVSHPLLEWLGLPNTIDSLRAELRQAGLPRSLDAGGRTRLRHPCP